MYVNWLAFRCSMWRVAAAKWHEEETRMWRIMYQLAYVAATGVSWRESNNQW